MTQCQQIVSADSHVTIPREWILVHPPKRLHEPLAHAEKSDAAKQFAASRRGMAFLIPSRPDRGRNDRDGPKRHQ